MSAPGEPQHPLQYAPHSGGRRWRRRVAAAVVLVASLAAAVHWGPPLTRHARLLYWQRQCLRYTVAPDTLVAEEATVYGPARAGNPFAAPEPLPLQRLRQMAPMPPQGGAVLFLGERRTPGGRRRLVVVRRHPFTSDPWSEFLSGYDAILIDPAGTRADPDHPFTYELIPSEMGEPPRRTTPLRFFAGQRDPVDESHFTIRYEMNGGRHTIDGWLRDPRGLWDPEPMRGSGFTIPRVEPWVELRLRPAPPERSRRMCRRFLGERRRLSP